MTEIWDSLVKGGIMMIPLILSIENPSEVEKALNEMKKNGGPFINIIRVGIDNRKRTKEEIRESILDQGRQEARKLERGLTILETIAGIAPLMGLLGTVLGMIKVFRVISEQGLGQTQALSSGISEALITTVVGLFIAIPALVSFNYFTHKVEDIVLEIEKYSGQLLNKLDDFQSRRKGKE